MNRPKEPYFARALECINGARSELANGRNNNAANRASYAAYNAAIVALIRAGIAGTPGRVEVQAASVWRLIHRCKTYPSALRSFLPDLTAMRIKADYARWTVSAREAANAVADAEHFERAVLRGER